MLIYATDNGNLEIIKYLVEEVGVDINEQNDSGEAAIHRCCYRKREEVLEYLINKGAIIEINKKPKLAKKWDQMMSPLNEACFRGSHGCVEVLLKHGAKIHFFQAKPIKKPF